MSKNMKEREMAFLCQVSQTTNIGFAFSNLYPYIFSIMIVNTVKNSPPKVNLSYLKGLDLFSNVFMVKRC